MRITQLIMLRNSIRTFNERRTNLDRLQNAITTGKEVQNPSDDPVRFSRALRFKETLAQQQQYLKNAKDASAWIDATLNSLAEIQSLVISAKEIAMKAADGMLDDEARQNFSVSIDRILDDVVSLANSKYLDKNLFGGTQTGEGVPFTKTDAGVEYSGNDHKITRRITQGFLLEVNVTGQQLIDTGVFDALVSLKEALANNDVDTVRDSLDILSEVNDNLGHLSAQSASVRNTLELTVSRLESTIIDLQSNISEEEDVNMAEAISKYEAEQMAYQAAMEVVNRIMNLNVLDYLR